MDVLLEEMALLMQEYTMKPGCRPFGSSLIVARLDAAESECECEHDESHVSNDNTCSGSFYRIDPAGSVTRLESIAYMGRGDGQKVIEKLKEAGIGVDGSCFAKNANANANDNDNANNSMNIHEAEKLLFQVLQKELQDENASKLKQKGGLLHVHGKQHDDDGDINNTDEKMICAKLGNWKERITISKTRL
jgi:20S proteasome alpha/beta subunit